MTRRLTAARVRAISKPGMHGDGATLYLNVAPSGAKTWMQQLERHAFPVLGDRPVDRIGREDVLRVLSPIWTSRAEAAR